MLDAVTPAAAPGMRSAAAPGIGEPPAPVPPASDLPIWRLIARLQTNAIAAWPRRAYQEMFLHRRCLGRDSYLVNDPEEARRIFLSDVDLFQRPLGFRRLFRPIMGEGLLLVEGARSREQRHRMAPAFTSRHVEKLIPRFLSVGERLLERLDGAGQANLSQLFQEVSIDAVGTAAFSMPLDPMSARIRIFRSNYFRVGAKVSILDHLARREDDFFLMRGTRGRHGRQGRSIVREIVRQRRSRPGHDLDSPDLLDLLLDAPGENGSGLTDTEIVDEAATILGTGFDTTGRAMFWTAYLLSLHPLAQDRVREELRGLSPTQVKGLADLDHWPFLRKCVWEALRLYPPLQVMVRVPLVPVEICGRAIRPGAYVAVSPWVMHRHEALWDRPNSFDPDRFPDDPRVVMRMRGFIPFGAGNRICIGGTFAMTEIVLILAQLLQRYEIQLDDERPVQPISMVTTMPSIEPTFRLRPVAGVSAPVAPAAVSYATPGDLRARMVAHIDALSALSLSESFGAHGVFAGLYVRTNRRLLAWFDTLAEPGVCYLTMIRFYEIYDLHIVQPVLEKRPAKAPHWRRYAELSTRLTLASDVNALLWLLSLGARAHIRHDLADAIRLAVEDYRRLFGRNPDFTAMRSALLDRATSEAFFEATIEFNRMHRGQQRGWRHLILISHVFFAWVSRPLMLGVLQSWRRAAWRDAMAALGRAD